QLIMRAAYRVHSAVQYDGFRLRPQPVDVLTGAVQTGAVQTGAVQTGAVPTGAVPTGTHTGRVL
ncbi:MAG: hypothetical protein NWR12_09245, partial [Haliea sp.]|nr:hypothetical protein [Haliea sp.]